MNITHKLDRNLIVNAMFEYLAKDLQQAFAQAEHAAAKHHYVNAVEAWGKQLINKAGHELHAAAVSLEHGLAWAALRRISIRAYTWFSWLYPMPF